MIKKLFVDVMGVIKFVHLVELKCEVCQMGLNLCTCNCKKKSDRRSDLKTWSQIGGAAQMCSYLCPTH
jgi:hypothetical protein